jgi:exopolysaccharide production protein ExoZ
MSKIPDFKKLSTLELYRFVAAVLVVFAHSNMFITLESKDFLENFLHFGTVGVDLFFVLSGFIIIYVHRSHFDHKEKLPSYLWRRVRRVYPLYAVITLISVPFIFLGIYRQDINFSFSYLFSNIFMLPRNATDYPIISPAWSLGHEVLFYLFVAVLIFNKKIGVVIFSLWGAGIIAFSASGSTAFPMSFIFSWLNIEFFIGMLAAYVAPRFPNKSGLFFLLSGLTMLSLSIYCHGTKLYPMTDPIWHRLIYGSCAFLIICGCVAWEKDRIKIPGSKALAYLGGASYTIYLIHFLVLELMYFAKNKFELPVNDGICFIAYSVTAISIGLITYHYTDRLLMQNIPSSWIKAKSHIQKHIRLFK